MSVILRRTLVVAGAAALAVGLLGAPASAHVTANAVNATQGSYTVISFRVPTERDNASTVGLRVEFPAADPLASVLVKPHVGWTYTVTKRQLNPPVQVGGRTLTEAVAAIEWTATALPTGTKPGAIKPGEFDEFDVSAGPMPAKDSITFRAVQTYSSGEQVVWTPTLSLAAPATQTATQPAMLQTGLQAEPVTSGDFQADDGAAGGAGGAYVLGGLGLVTGLAGLALAFTTRRRSAAPQG